MSTPFISIDPGFANAAYVAGEYSINENARKITVNIKHKCIDAVLEVGKADCGSIAVAVTNWIDEMDFVNSNSSRLVALIEHQYPSRKLFHVSSKLMMFETACCCALSRLQADVLLLPSKMVKRSLGLNSKRKKNAYAERKKLAVDFCCNLLKTEKKRVTHHIADCVNQLHFYLKCLYPSFKIEYF